PPPRDARPPAPAGDVGTITGVVVSDEAQPRPLRRARVSLGRAGLTITRGVVTADDGSFVFDRVPPGRFSLLAEKEAYVPRRDTALIAGAGQAARVTLRLPRGAVVSGTVLDIDGQPAQ